MVAYDLTHLTQRDAQDVWGPIQDDEALLLLSVVRGMRMTNVLEIGGLDGYSARNFLAAFAEPHKSIMWTVDINPVSALAPNHRVIVKDARDLTRADLDGRRLDMVFFDCHDAEAQMGAYAALRLAGAITDATVIALHDTNLHFAPYNRHGPYVEAEGGYAHQEAERLMVVLLQGLGYHAFQLHTTRHAHSDAFPYRHGITLMQIPAHIARASGP
jgi:predicted O-methyltransferase YrrM